MAGLLAEGGPLWALPASWGPEHSDIGGPVGRPPGDGAGRLSPVGAELPCVRWGLLPLQR